MKALFGLNKNKGLFLSLFLFEAINLAGFEMSKWIGFLGLFLLYFLVKSVYDDSYSTLSDILNKRFFLILLVFQGLGWFIHVFTKYFSVACAMYDSGAFAHLLFNISSGRGFYHDVLSQTSAWADHFTPNLALFAPLFWLKPSILWLPFVRWIAYLVCLPILWEISKFYLQDKKWRYLILFLWLINYAMSKVLIHEFQMSNLALPFILLAFYLYLKKHYILFGLNLLWLLGFKENMALAWLSIGVWLFFFQKKRTLGISIIAGGIIAGVVIVHILTPYFSGGIPNLQLDRLGPFELLPQKAKFIFLVLLSVGFFPLLNPSTLLFILPAFGTSLLSNKPSMSTIHHHYQDIPTTVIFIAVIIALSTWEKKQGWFFSLPLGLQKISIIIMLSGIILYNNHYPARIIRQLWPTSADLETLSEIHRFKKEIDPQRVLWTLNTLGAYFIEIPYLRLFEFYTPQREEKTHYLVLDNKINDDGLKQKIEEILRNNKYEELAGYKELRIYKSK